ncbi:UNVERIFIED_CONTAM: hypothetical protein Slati_4574100 [Sesamum latifolium]|uniref:Uncharacterized protein n=1 Tax=Sesamum latifolium TaxID=2727402 RepID=A0AAW2SFX4_9LAMI
MLSHPSVGRDPESCLRFWRSFVDLRISPLHTKFHSPLSHSSELVSRAFRQFLATFTFNPIHRLRALYAQSFRRTLAPPSYRGCWHGVSRGFFLESCHDRALDEELYKRHCPSSLTRYCWIGLSPIVQDSPLLPPWESGPCLSPSVADRPKRPAKHHWLGQPLPDQLPNTTQAHQTALFSFLQDLARTVRQIPTRYAPVRHFFSTLLTWARQATFS